MTIMETHSNSLVLKAIEGCVKDGGFTFVDVPQLPARTSDAKAPQHSSCPEILAMNKAASIQMNVSSIEE